MSRQKHRLLTCPRCGAEVKIPLFWAIGIEGIFRCPNCRMPFKTGYKMGAIFMALALTLAVTTVQLLVYLFSIYSMVLFVLALIPLWLFYGYHFQRLVRHNPPIPQQLPIQISTAIPTATDPPQLHRRYKTVGTPKISPRNSAPVKIRTIASNPSLSGYPLNPSKINKTSKNIFRTSIQISGAE